MAHAAPAPGVSPHVRHMPAVISLNWLHIRRDVAAVDGINAKVAILLTRVVGTMWCFWAFNGIALVSLPSAISQGSLTVLINWVSSNWIQLILLPALMVGQNLMQVAANHQQEILSQHMDLVVDRLDTKTEGGLQVLIHLLYMIMKKLGMEIPSGDLLPVPAVSGEGVDEPGQLAE